MTKIQGEKRDSIQTWVARCPREDTRSKNPVLRNWKACEERGVWSDTSARLAKRTLHRLSLVYVGLEIPLPALGEGMVGREKRDRRDDRPRRMPRDLTANAGCKATNRGKNLTEKGEVSATMRGSEPNYRTGTRNVWGKTGRLRAGRHRKNHIAMGADRSAPAGFQLSTSVGYYAKSKKD